MRHEPAIADGVSPPPDRHRRLREWPPDGTRSRGNAARTRAAELLLAAGGL